MNLKYYKITHSRAEIRTIYDLSTKKKTQDTIMSLLWYYKKYSNADGNLKYSLSRLHKMYCRNKKIARSYFFKLMQKIKEEFFSGKVLKEDKKEDRHNTPQNLAKTGFGSNSTKHNYKNNNNTNTIKEIAKLFKGVTGDTFATKSDLKEIAKTLFVANNIKNGVVQAQVFSKIKYSKTKVNLLGAVQYVNTICMEKISAYDAMHLNLKEIF